MPGTLGVVSGGTKTENERKTDRPRRDERERDGRRERWREGEGEKERDRARDSERERERETVREKETEGYRQKEIGKRRRAAGAKNEQSDRCVFTRKNGLTCFTSGSSVCSMLRVLISRLAGSTGSGVAMIRTQLRAP